MDAIHVFSNSRRSNLSIKYQNQGSKMNELRVALRVLAEHLDLSLSNMPLPVRFQALAFWAKESAASFR